MNWYLKALKSYAVFHGRARRREYWNFTLFNTLLAFLLGVLSMLLFSSSMPAELLVLGTVLPSLAVSVRRLHDIGKSGWWLLFGIIPLVGPITLFIFHLREGDDGENAYGSDPKMKGMDLKED